MVEPFADTETDRTKSRWLAKAYQDFVKETGRSKTTLRALFYYALQRNDSDYPICGYFVGEIRVTRQYHESDGEKLPKWIKKAVKLGYIPADAILEEIPGEYIFSPEVAGEDPYSIEVWLNKSALNTILYPICEKYGSTLVSVNGKASEKSMEELFLRLEKPTTILCLSDLSYGSAFFAQDLATKIEKSRPLESDVDIRVKCIGLLPEQVSKLKIPMVPGSPDSKENKDKFRKYLKSYALDPKKIAELDALEIYFPGGMAGFLNECLSKYKCDFNPDDESMVAGSEESYASPLHTIM